MKSINFDTEAVKPSGQTKPYGFIRVEMTEEDIKRVLESRERMNTK